MPYVGLTGIEHLAAAIVAELILFFEFLSADFLYLFVHFAFLGKGSAAVFDRNKVPGSCLGQVATY